MNKDTSKISLIVSNLVPLFGIIFWGWSLPLIMILYWVESAVIGVINVLKIYKAQGNLIYAGTSLYVNGIKVKNPNSKKVLIPFFILHYGIFTLCHGLFVFTLFGSMGVTFMTVMMGILSILISHIISYKVNYIGKEEFRNVSPSMLFFQPYKRVFIMHICMMLAGFFSQQLGIPVYTLVGLVILKIIFDLFLHNKEHAKLQEVPVESDIEMAKLEQNFDQPSKSKRNIFVVIVTIFCIIFFITVFEKIFIQNEFNRIENHFIEESGDDSQKVIDDEIYCSDSDQGYDIYNKGILEWRSNSGEILTNVDYCTEEGEFATSITEFGCVDNESYSKVFDCAKGCNDGACNR